MRDAELNALDWNYCRANAAFFASSRTGEAFESEGLFISHSGVGAAHFNTAFLKSPLEDLSGQVRLAEAFFRERDLPFRLAVRDSYESAVTHALQILGYGAVQRVPGMVLSPIGAVPAAPPALRIEEVRTPEVMATFRETAFMGFELPAGAAGAFLTDQLLDQPEIGLYLGWVGDEPVCTSALFTSGPIAGIYWVGTVPSHRGRGLGEAITWAAVDAGRRRGCRLASLQASQVGRSVYERMGFETPLHYVHFAPLKG